MAVKVTVEYSGNFFKYDPVGRLHKNVYRDVLPELAEVAAASAAANVTVVTGALRDSIEPRLVKASKFNNWTGRARAIAGARGSRPSELRNRAAARSVQNRRRFMFRAGALAQSWVNSNTGKIAAKLTKGLS